MSRYLSSSLEELKREFDQAFALPAEDTSRKTDDFLEISAGATPYLMRVAELSALEWRRKITPLPTVAPALLGIAGLQGRIVPVYRLSAILGKPTSDEDADWLAVCRGNDAVALAFGTLNGHLRVPREYFHRAANQQYIEGALRRDSNVRHVLDVPAIVAAIRGDMAAGIIPTEN